MHQQTPHMKKEPGFTLLEILVSVAILGVIVLSLGRIFILTTDATIRARNTVLLDQTARQFFTILSHDLSQAYLRTNMPFRVHTINGLDTLAFITASRIGLEASTGRAFLAKARDSHVVTYALQAVGTNLFYIERASPRLLDDGTTDNAAALFHAASDFYSNTNDNLMQPRQGDNTIKWSSTDALTSALIYEEDTDESTRNSSATTQVIVQSVTFRINGRATPATNHEYQPRQLIDPADIPRFVDIDLELITKRDRDLYSLFLDHGNIAAADIQLRKSRRIYARRFPLTTRPVEALEFN